MLSSLTETKLIVLLTLKLELVREGRRGEKVKEEGEEVDDIAGPLT